MIRGSAYNSLTLKCIKDCSSTLNGNICYRNMRMYLYISMLAQREAVRACSLGQRAHNGRVQRRMHTQCQPAAGAVIGGVSASATVSRSVLVCYSVRGLSQQMYKVGVFECCAFGMTSRRFKDLARYEKFSKSVNSNQLIYHNLLGMLDSTEEKQQRYFAMHTLYRYAFPPAPPAALWPAPASGCSSAKRGLDALSFSPDASVPRKRLSLTAA
eukprot:8550-Heterococcus_DN1.PRE.1